MPLLWFIAYFYDKRRARLEAERVEAAKAARARCQASETPAAAAGTGNLLPIVDPRASLQTPVSPGGKSSKRISGSEGYNRLDEH